jgi:hypothetical protein
MTGKSTQTNPPREKRSRLKAALRIPLAKFTPEWFSGKRHGLR